MKNGYVGTIIRVNLESGKITKEPLNEKNAHDYSFSNIFHIEYLKLKIINHSRYSNTLKINK